MMTPQFYLFFKGDCLEAMTHYAETLGGTIEGVFLNKDAARRKSGCRAATILS
jgi:PhnB protein